MHRNKVISIFTDETELVNYKNITNSLNSDKNIEHKSCTMFNNNQYTTATHIDFKFNINKSTKSLVDVTNEILLCLERFLALETPTIILVYEDSITAFASALAAFYQKISIIHINSSKRILEIHSQFSEIMNRKLTSALSDFHFVDSKYSEQILIDEGIDKNKIFILNDITSKGLIKEIICNATLSS